MRPSLASASEGTFDFNKDRSPIISLNDLWRFHVGDDPRFAGSDFDDTAWQLVPAVQTAENHVSLPEGPASFWYRAKVSIPPGTPPLSLYVPRVRMNYEVFIDGQEAGGIGGMPPHTTPTAGMSEAYPLPAVPVATGQNPRVISIAIRCWKFVRSSQSSDTDLGPRIRLGATPLIEETITLRTRSVFWYSASDLFLALLNTLAGLTAMCLFLFRRQEKEYLWYSLLTLVLAVTHVNLIWIDSHVHGWPQDLLKDNLLRQSSSLALMVFLYRLLGGKRDRLFWIAISSVMVSVLFALADFVPNMFREEWMWADIRLYNGLSFLLFLPFAAWVIALVTRKASERIFDARLLLPSIVLVALANTLDYGLGAAQTIFQGEGSGWESWFFTTSEWPIPFSFQNLSEVFLLLSMLAVLTRRFTRTRLREEAYEREREAARSVQRVLVPEAIPIVPGFQIATVYKPIGEVGGDFVQVIPIALGSNAGSLLVVIGDVSGKGIPAAMTVSLLVGTVRTLAHYTQSPAEILAAMNQRMIGRSNGGFTTCLALRAAPNGTVVFANAGHVSPYVSSGEVELEGGLPLGLSEDAVYPESTIYLALNDQLTLITDGVIEARSKTGELFGFDRTHSISRESPEWIASAAQHFGQDDDITVLSICRI